MPHRTTSLSATADDPGMAEARMRRALGLVEGISPARTEQHRLEPARSRHRFVRDGEVPVVVRGARASDAAPSEASAAVQAALVVEQATRIVAERSLAEALAVVRSLRTTLAHAELAHGEALAAERQARERAEMRLRDTVAACETAGRRAGELGTGQVGEAPAPRARTGKATSAQPRTAAAGPRDPQPVKWWLPSHKAARPSR